MPINEWAMLSMGHADEIPDLPDAEGWQMLIFNTPPGPRLRSFEMELEDDPLACDFNSWLQDDVWMYECEDGSCHALSLWPGQLHPLRGRLAVRPLPSPLVLNCDFSMVNCRRFEAVCFCLAGKELLRIQEAACPDLTIRQLVKIVKDDALEQNMLNSRNQPLHVSLNGAKNILANDNSLFHRL